MTNSAASPAAAAPLRRPRRLWPGVLIVSLMLAIRFFAPLIDPDWSIFALLAGVAGSLLVALWWLFFSRAPWVERLGVIAFAVIAVVATKPLLDKSIATGAM